MPSLEIQKQSAWPGQDARMNLRVYRTTIVLRGATMKLLQKLFPKVAQLEAAEKRAETAEADLSETKRQLATLWESYHSHDATVKAQRETIDGLKSKLLRSDIAACIYRNTTSACAFT
jgi:septal ring factor EnvC (AmiA/AmiB activator)